MTIRTPDRPSVLRTGRALLGLLLLLCGPAVLAQQNNGTAQPVVRAEFSVSLPELDAEIRRLEGLKDSDLPDRAAILDDYRAARSAVAGGRSHAQDAREFHAAGDSAPGQTDTLQDQLKSGKVPPAARLPALPDKAPLSSLEDALNTGKASLAALRQQEADLQRQFQEETARTTEANEALTKARAALTSLETTRGEREAAGDARAKAALLALDARIFERSNELVALEEELRTNPARIALLSARREVVLRQIESLTQPLGELEARVMQLRAAAEEREQDAVSALLESLQSKPEPLQKLGNAYALLVAESGSLDQKIQAAEKRAASAGDNRRLTGTTAQEIGNLLKNFERNRSLAPLLMERIRSFPDPVQLGREADGVVDQLSDARLRLFEIESTQRTLSDLDAAAAAALGKKEASGPDVRKEAHDLLALQRSELTELSNGYRRHVVQLGALESDLRDTVRQTRESLDLVRQHILWTRSTLPMGRESVQQFWTSLTALLSQGSQGAFLQTVLRDQEENWPLHVAGSLVPLLLLLGRRRMVRTLDTLGSTVGKVGEDRISHTAGALLLSVLLAAPLPLLVWFPCWRVRNTPDTDATSFAMAQGMHVTAIYLFGFLCLFELCRRQGVLRQHFRWSAESCARLRHFIAPLLVVAMPLQFVFETAEALPAEGRQALGRVAFILWMLILSGALALILHPRRGLPSSWLQAHPNSLLHRLRFLWYPLTVGEPLALVVLAGLGYYLSARLFDRVFSSTAFFVILCILGSAFFHRWLLLSQRRLAYRVALEKRKSILKAREQDGLADGESLPDPAEEIDVVEISRQNLALLRTAFGVITALGLLMIWSPVLPAFKVLKDVGLWDVERTVSGIKQMESVSLFNLLVSLASVALTVVAARNIPGFLEITVLQRLPLDSGTRYAVKSISLYVIVTAGLIYSFGSLGIGWSSIQWLVAGLSVGLGFGLQEIFANFVSGIIILLERPVRVGDTVTVNGVTGTVSRIRMRATTVTDWDRKELIVPNKNFITTQLVNWTLSDPIIRMTFNVGIAYGSDTALAHRVLRETVEAHPFVLDTPKPDVLFLEFADSSLRFEVRVFVSDNSNINRAQVLHDLHMAIDRTCRENGIEIAFPQRDLHLRTADAVLRVQQVPAPGEARSEPPSLPSPAPARDPETLPARR